MPASLSVRAEQRQSCAITVPSEASFRQTETSFIGHTRKRRTPRSVPHHLENAVPKQTVESSVSMDPTPFLPMTSTEFGRGSGSTLAQLDHPSKLQSGLGSEALLNSPVTDSAESIGEAGITAEAAEQFIEGKRIGDRIKYLRQRKAMGLVELGRHTGLSASFLSQLETGRVVPTLRNLARIAIVFSKDMSYFFEPERSELFRVLRAEDRQRLPQSGVEDPGYFFESLGHVPMDGGISPYVAEFLPATAKRQPRSHSHAGAEFLYILNGCMRLTHESTADVLENGDAVFFHANTTHSYERVGDENCLALIITMQEHPHGQHTGSRIPVRSGKNNSQAGTAKRRR